jgi:hypothetical protein
MEMEGLIGAKRGAERLNYRYGYGDPTENWLASPSRLIAARARTIVITISAI